MKCLNITLDIAYDEQDWCRHLFLTLHSLNRFRFTANWTWHNRMGFIFMCVKSPSRETRSKLMHTMIYHASVYNYLTTFYLCDHTHASWLNSGKDFAKIKYKFSFCYVEAFLFTNASLLWHFHSWPFCVVGYFHTSHL